MKLASLLAPKVALPIGLLIALPALLLPACGGGDDDAATGGAGGAGGSAGSGSGGMATSGSAGTGTALPLPDVGCDYTTIITKSCSSAGCHRINMIAGMTVIAGDLDLTLNDGFRSRVVNAPAAHSQIDCDPDPVAYMACTTPPAACPAGAKIVDTANPANSWVLKKLDGGGMCGDAMPLPPGDSATMGWSPTAKTCLQSLFNALAAGQ